MINHIHPQTQPQEDLLAQLEIVNRKLVNSERLKSNFLSNLKNELNNPMTSIMGLLKSLTSVQTDPSINNKIRLAYQEALNLHFQVQNVLMAAEIEAGTISPRISSIAIESLVEKTRIELHKEVKDKNIDIFFENNTKRIFQSDADLLHIILLNLLSNAIKFCKVDSAIKISVESTPADHVILCVEDTGNGIPAHKMSQILDRFSQLEEGTSKSFGGHGLGLTIAHSLTEILGGNLTIESEENQGTSVTIDLPMVVETDFSDEYSEEFTENESIEWF
jgi:signal transduction histidine kinase